MKNQKLSTMKKKKYFYLVGKKPEGKTIEEISHYKLAIKLLTKLSNVLGNKDKKKLLKGLSAIKKYFPKDYIVFTLVSKEDVEYPLSFSYAKTGDSHNDFHTLLLGIDVLKIGELNYVTYSQSIMGGNRPYDHFTISSDVLAKFKENLDASLVILKKELLS